MSAEERAPARRARKKAETRRAIADAASRLFTERGFEAVTVVEIAEAADVSAKTVFNYFPAKEQLFFEQGQVPASAVLERGQGESVAAAVLRSLRPPADLAYARVYRDSPALRSYGRELFASHERALADALTHDQTGLPPGILAAVMLGSLREVWESMLLSTADGTTPEEAFARGVNDLNAALALVQPRVEAPVRHRAGDSVARGARPSITRVAQVAGVSATTVSHTLNGRRPVAEETRRRVLEAIEQLGYRPNALARGLRTSRSQTVGLVIPDITNPFYPALARGLQDVLGPAGYDQIISNTDGDRRMEQAAIEQMIARQVDGLAFAVFHTHPEDLLPAIDAGIPVVRLGGRLVQDGVDVVHSDDEGGSAEATRYLLERGYRRIGFVCGPAAEGPAAERVAGYSTALADQPPLVVHTQFSRAGGAEGTARLLDLPEPPDAVLCANDVMAIGALDAAASRGLRVPEDLAVMGFDDIDAASMVSPGLTTMANPAREIGQASARRLLDRLEGRASMPHTEVIIGARLVRRQSA